jgi:riboflavin synthase
MFTGLITDIGRITSIERGAEHCAIEVSCGYDVSDLQLGESIAVDGACLTVTQIGSESVRFDASPETLRRTTLGDRSAGDRVHLERALRVGDRMGGHMVLGHVDGVGTVRQIREEGNAWLLSIEAPVEVVQYLIDKGSIAVDGVSLTVNSIEDRRFGLAIIPHTAEETNLTRYRVGRRVNLEADVLGKYVRRFLFGEEGDDTQDGGGISREMLAEFGFGS